MSDTCFVIAPIGDAGSDARKRSDQVLKHIIKPACEKFNFTGLALMDWWRVAAPPIADPSQVNPTNMNRIVQAWAERWKNSSKSADDK